MKIQDSTRCNVHRFYTPSAFSNQRTPVPMHLLKGKGMLWATWLKPFQTLEEGLCVVGHAILEWMEHFTFQMHSDMGRFLNIFFRTSNQIANIAT